MVSLAHGSLNNWGQYAFKFMTSSGAYDDALLALVNGALLLVGLVALQQIGSERTTENPKS